MPRTTTVFFCTECGNESPRWQGQCPASSAWNTLVEEPKAPAHRRGAAPGARGRRGAVAAGEGSARPVKLAEVAGGESLRWRTGLGELDYVLGGGIVPGSLVLVGGEPGVGKSTLLLQVAARLEAAGEPTLYVSGEESAAQVRLRADRLVDGAGEVTFLGETALEPLLERASERQPSVLFVDSIQTVYTAELEGAPGNVGQVRERSEERRVGKECRSRWSPYH